MEAWSERLTALPALSLLACATSLWMATDAGAVASSITIDGKPDQTARVERGPLPSTFIEPSVDMIFVRLPGGCFEMGDEKVGKLSEICIDSFYLGMFEVTNAQFRRFKPDHVSGSIRGQDLSSPEQPAVNVTWHEAKAFCDWLTKAGDGLFRLPTEAEWEYAALAGHDQALPNANFAPADGSEASDGFQVTAPVGSFQPDQAGLHDLFGNASEWVADVFVSGPLRYGAARTNPVAIGASDLHVRRGGSWSDPPNRIKASSRDYYLGTLAVPETGFRVVMER